MKFTKTLPILAFTWILADTTLAATSLEIQMVPMLKLTGEVGSTTQIQFVTDLSQTNNWITLTNIVLSTSPSYYFDTSSAGLPTRRYFRAVQLTSSQTTNNIPANLNPANMVWIGPGTFTMGSPATEKERQPNEGPQTEVTLTKGFWMGKYEVTQREYLAVMGNNPSRFTTKDYNGKAITPDLSRPVEQVSWNDATNYCARLTASEKAVGRLPVGWVYRLPTEAEWEYACRAGTSTAFHYGNDLRSGMANFRGPYEYVGGTGTLTNSNGTYLARTTAVGSYAPNAFGLYDMHGNVWEWCLDRWAESLPGGSVTDPKWPTLGLFRVFRGGSWDSEAKFCRSAVRFINFGPDYMNDVLGFRPVLAPGQ